MISIAPSPHPRGIPRHVTLTRRASEGRARAPERSSVEELKRWLIADAIRDHDFLTLVDSLCWRAQAAGLPLNRMSVHFGTLHPQVVGFAWVWSDEDGLTDELRVRTGNAQTDSFLKSPIRRVMEEGVPIRANPRDPETAEAMPLMAELAEKGFTDYALLPLNAGAHHNSASIATRAPGGFDAETYRTLSGVLELFALHVERHIQARIAASVMETYLGPLAGRQVLDGAIARGAGRAIEAVIWSSDLRGYTVLADRLPGEDVTKILNAYFEGQVAAVIAHGGEILKFIGDGLLAVFPLDGQENAARAALDAASDALRRLDALNDAPPEELENVAGWRPLRAGVALHEGEVFFGNVGAPERLDFTVIGRAVNEASRVEALTKELGRPIVVTEAVARRSGRTLEDLGSRALRGRAEPIGLFAPRP